jgi:5-oxoprolinase (ATP-hydrolysing)
MDQGIDAARIDVLRRAHLNPDSTDSRCSSRRPVFPRCGRSSSAYRARVAFTMPDREVVVEAVSVEAIGKGFDAEPIELRMRRS